MKSAFSRIERTLQNLLARAVVTGLDTAKKCQMLQVELMPGEPKENVEHLEPYGFTSAPITGAEGFALFPDGDRSHGVILIVADRRYRVKGLAAGEVAIYTDEGDTLTFKRGNIVELNTKIFNVNAADAVNIKTKSFNVNAANATDIKTKIFTLDASTSTALTTAACSIKATYTVSVSSQQIGLNGNLTVSDAGGGAAGNAVLRGNLMLQGNQQTTGTSTATDHLSSGKSGALHRHPGDSGGTTGTPI
ncbi:phage baseplate assembly protein V [Enterobacter hormaechei]|uniref:phage baseplate assembly protein V n=1 Tax=Enterobacter hormaechei TaxID=158836 RepID=UPI000E1CBCDA|nr:phage baseplate assembly protein V [Enterobacter hormaechei]MCI9500172.1 phage baseplate assembly protein [Enterobacter hormaechei subsp. steigerwaltii]ELD3428691.1 phage baseplate assembly protein [Enterobacter hormaechei]MCM7436905.1 phage baseplate assembly protein V [Enterobacter hormaechei]RDT10334.1 phage baseplate assembly protein V [Enterobacter hormaechei]RDT29269.1 phage baseplate assembly protein V [Enterobacter hormaechei]